MQSGEDERSLDSVAKLKLWVMMGRAVKRLPQLGSPMVVKESL